MRGLIRALLVMLVPAMVVTGVSTAEAAPETPVLAAAEVACTGFSIVDIGSGYNLHVPSVGGNSYNYNCVVVRGHHDIAVLVVQESLNACYQQGISEDSDFGGNTERAVRNAQTRINQAAGGSVVGVDGRFGPQTSSYFLFQAYDAWNGGAHTGWCVRR